MLAVTRRDYEYLNLADRVIIYTDWVSINNAMILLFEAPYYHGPAGGWTCESLHLILYSEQ